MKDLILRKATSLDLKEILQLQVDVFNAEQKIPASMIPLPAENSPRWWCALMDTTIVGAVAAWEYNSQVHWGRFVIMHSYRGLHIGTRLARFSLDDLFSQEIQEIYMDARDTTVKIICSMGGKIIGQPTEFYGTVTPVVISKKDYKKGNTNNL